MTRRNAPTLLTFALMTAGAIIEHRPWLWDWSQAGKTLVDHVGLLVLCLGAGLGTARVLAMLAERARAETVRSRSRWHPLLSTRGIATSTAAVVALGVVAMVAMLVLASNAGAERPKLQIDAIKYSLGVFAAAGAVAALLLGIRRQKYTERDSAARRITDLYTAAAEQLGHADAAVRLAGLYALERLAQDNFEQRQTIVNVICAYLRMPYSLPETKRSVSPRILTELPLRSPALDGLSRDPHQELQVRLTAQSILKSHLALPVGMRSRDAAGFVPDLRTSFWPGIELDLTSATLVDWSLDHGHVRGAVFDGAIFIGGALFAGAIFTNGASFEGATFNSDVWFGNASFAGAAWFRGATFNSGAGFRGMNFDSGVWFEGATFNSDVWFDGTTFFGAYFNDATFSKRPDMSECRVPLRDYRNDVWPDGWRINPNDPERLIYLAANTISAGGI